MYATNPFAPTVGPLYRQVRAEAGVHAATPHRLVAMLFEGLLEAIAQARGALQAGQVQAKGAAIGRAVAILEEGLRGGLDLSAGPLAQDLNRLYSYLSTRLTLANLRSDDRLLQECQSLVRPLQEAWAAIAMDTHSASQAQPTHPMPTPPATPQLNLNFNPNRANAGAVAAPAAEPALSPSFANP